MKLKIYKPLLYILMVLTLAMTASSLPAQVYKIVDEDGKVTYTDQPPNDGSKPIELAPISIIEAPIYEATPKSADKDVDDGNRQRMSLGDLRRNYKDFAIVAPQSEESIWLPAEAIRVVWQTRYQLQAGMKATVFIDGKQQASTAEKIIPVSGLERGEHTVTAELNDVKNRKIATAKPVIFFVRQPNIHTNRTQPGG